MEKSLFNLPQPIGMDIPFENLHVWQWMKNQPRDSISKIAYLQAFGFDSKIHRITEEQYHILDCAMTQYFRIAPIISKKMKRTDVFDYDKKDNLFTIIESGQPVKYLSVKATILGALISDFWLGTNQNDFYFEIINGKLWAKYSTILGSRPVVELAD
jgi:hypothetical protein